MTDGDLAIAHGGGLIAARARFPDAPEPWIDLSTGINALPYPVSPLSPAVYHRLPEPEQVRQLEAAAARAYGVADPAMVVAAPGTQILISLLPRLLRRESVAIVGPTYAEHAAAWTASGSAVRIIDGIDTLGEERTLVLCNPNNPDGRRFRDAELVQLAERLDLLVVDEAFADLEEPGLSIAPMLPGNAVVLRSFGKTYGLAGLRLGFAIAAPAMAQMIRVALGPWAVSGAAVEIGAAALADSAWLIATRVRLVRDISRLDALLAKAGLQVIGGTRLFRLAAISDGYTTTSGKNERPLKPSPSGRGLGEGCLTGGPLGQWPDPHPDPLSEGEGKEGVFTRLGRAGILVRRFAAEPTWLRFGIPGDGWDRLAAALARPDP